MPHKRLILILLITVALALTACQQEAEDTTLEDIWGVLTIDPGEPIQIAAATAMNENLVGPEGLEQLRGIEMAVAQRGNIRGFPVEVVPIDTGCSAGRGPAAAIQIFSEAPHLVAVVGHTCSVSCLPSVSSYDSVGMSIISPSCGATTLTDELLHTESFARTIYNDVIEGNSAAEFAFNELGARRAAIIHDGTADTEDLQAAFTTTFTFLGGIITSVVEIAPGTESLSQALQDARGNSPDLIYAPLLAGDAARLTLQKRGSMLNALPLLGGRHYWSDWYIQTAGLGTDGVYAVGPRVNPETFADLSRGYEEIYGAQPTSTAFMFAYDATTLALRAIEYAAVSTRSGQLQIGKYALHEEIYNTVNLSGLTGELSCTAWGNCSAGLIAVGQVRDNQWVTVFVP